MKTIYLLLLVMLLSVTSVYAQDTVTQEPGVIIKNMVDEVISSLKEDNELIRNHKKTEEFVATKVLDRFDFAYMAKLTVGEKHWESANAQERSGLVDEYRTFLAHIFSNALSQYENQTVSFAPFHLSPDANDAVVKSKLIDPGDETSNFDFKLVRTTEGWKIYDIDLGGIDLIRTYKSNFSGALQNGGVPKLINELHKKNQELKTARKD
jgi:phospholipid transport system substrate-binding protein